MSAIARMIEAAASISGPVIRTALKPAACLAEGDIVFERGYPAEIAEVQINPIGLVGVRFDAYSPLVWLSGITPIPVVERNRE